jgi:uncharacterized protein (DUF58 family)
MSQVRPRASSLPHLTVRGWGLVVLAIVAFVLTQLYHRQEFAYLGCFALALPVFSLLWVAIRKVSLKITRRFSPETGAVGQRVVTTIFLQNWSAMRSPAAVWVEHAAPPLFSSDPASMPSFPGFSSATLDQPVARALNYRLDTRFRGAHRVGPFEVTLSDPFGCAARRVVVGGTDTVLITPAVYELSRIDLRLSSGDGAEQISRRLVGAGEQDVIARKYLPGDSIRRVHWPATAKHGELMVRQDDQRNDQDAVVMLDASSFSGGSPATGALPDPAFEWAVSAVGSIAVHLMNEGFGVRLVGHAAGVADGPEVLTAPHGIPRVLRELTLSRSDALSDPAEFRIAVEDASLTSPDAPPVFAFVSAAAGADARVRSLAGMSSHPMAFVISAADASRPGTRSPRTAAHPSAAPGEVASRLRQAGWNVVECRAGDSLPVLWKAVGQSRGVA